MKNIKFYVLLLVSLLCIIMLPGGRALAATTTKDTSTKVVTFDLNYKGAPKLESKSVKVDAILTEDAKPQTPTRKGYKFAGWYKTKNPVMKNGVSKDEWLFGKKYMDWSGVKEIKGEVTSMPVKDDIVLYARWVKPIAITSVKDLNMIRKDLSGWYILKKDINLSSVKNWTPIGAYDSTYEFANAEWWQLAFRGVFDGDDHVITGLKITSTTFTAGFFGAVCNAEVKDLTIKDYNINVKASKGIYAAPLSAVAQGTNTKITNCKTNGTIKLTVNDSKSEMVYTSATGLVAGAWAGVIDKCTTNSNITLIAHVKNGGEIFAAGISGEGYSTTKNNFSTVNINCYAESDAKPGKNSEDMHLEAYVGGLQAVSTNTLNSISTGKIVVGVKKDKGATSVNAGGISGNERYGFIENCRSDVSILVNEGRNIYVAGILGSFNETFGQIGSMFGIKRYEVFNCIAMGKITVADGYKRDKNGVHIGAAVGALPSDAKYRAENVAYINYYNGITLSDDNVTLKAYKTKQDLYGNALKSLLGDEGWVYVNGKLPKPSIRTTWDPNSERESLLSTEQSAEETANQSDSSNSGTILDINGTYEFNDYGNITLIINTDNTYSMSGIAGDSEGTYSVTASTITLTDKDNKANSYKIRQDEIDLTFGTYVVTLKKVK